MESNMPYTHIRQLQACARERARAIDKTGHLQECPRDHRHQALPDDQRERDSQLNMIYSINPIFQTNMRDTCEIHARYIRDTCNLRGNQDTCGIHAEYMRDTWGIYMRDTYLGGLGLSKRGRK